MRARGLQHIIVVLGMCCHCVDHCSPWGRELITEHCLGGADAPMPDSEEATRAASAVTSRNHATDSVDERAGGSVPVCLGKSLPPGRHGT